MHILVVLCALVNDDNNNWLHFDVLYLNIGRMKTTNCWYRFSHLVQLQSACFPNPNIIHFSEHYISSACITFLKRPPYYVAFYFILYYRAYISSDPSTNPWTWSVKWFLNLVNPSATTSIVIVELVNILFRSSIVKQISAWMAHKPTVSIWFTTRCPTV